MTARASGAFASPPTSQPSAIGRRPKTVARLVIRIGRSRVRPARTTASPSGSPRRLSSLVYSTRSTPFETTIPTIMMMPMNEVVERVVRVTNRARMTPMRPIGTENMMMNGSLRERN
jgi:hypothetical protein